MVFWVKVILRYFLDGWLTDWLTGKWRKSHLRKILDGAEISQHKRIKKVIYVYCRGLQDISQKFLIFVLILHFKITTKQKSFFSKEYKA